MMSEVTGCHTNDKFCFLDVFLSLKFGVTCVCKYQFWIILCCSGWKVNHFHLSRNFFCLVEISRWFFWNSCATPIYKTVFKKQLQAAVEIIVWRQQKWILLWLSLRTIRTYQIMSSFILVTQCKTYMSSCLPYCMISSVYILLLSLFRMW